MPTLNLLTEAQREQLGIFPELDSREIARYFTLSDEDLKLIHKRRGDPNRLGFAVQLAHLRFPGWTYSANSAVPTAMLLYLAKQVQINPTALNDYAKERDATKHEHLTEITQAYGFRRFAEVADELRTWLLDVALSTDNGFLLVQTLIERMRECKVIIPSLYTVERMAWEVRLQARTHVQGRLTSWLSETQKTKLDRLLLPEEVGGSSPLAWLRLAPQNPTPRGFLRLLEKLEHIRDLKLDDAAAKHLHQNRLRALAREGARATPHNLKRLAAEHRYAVLVAFLLDISAKITDELLEMHDRMMSSLLRRSENQRDEAFSKQGKSINEKVQLYATLGRALIEAKEDGNDPFEVIDSLLGWDTFTTTVEEAWGLAQPLNFDYLMFMLNRFTWLRQYTPRLVASFDFKAARATRDLLAAIELLRELNQEKRRKLPQNAPTGFVKPRWQPYVFGAGGIDRRYYELCILNELRQRLRSGDLWVSGSQRFRDFEDYLLPRETWQSMLAVGDVPVAVSLNGDAYLQARSEDLSQALADADGRIQQGELLGVSLKDGRLSITPLKTDRPEGVRTLRNALYRLLPRVRLTELLVEVDSWTHFSRHFTHLQSGMPCREKNLLFSALLSDGINLGLEKMAQACPGLDYDRLAWVADWHIRDETYRQALADLVNAHHHLPFSKHWGDGTTSSSDGQYFRAGGQQQLPAQRNLRYGREPGSTFYSHLSDQYAPFHTKVIATTARDATHVLDGLLYHETDLDIQEHYTDTHGYTDQVFAMCHLLGFRFAPRIRDLADKRLYSVDGPGRYKTLQSLIAAKINLRQIRDHWDDVLRLASSIKKGSVTASLILGKLAAYPRQNGLAWALREIGRVERTLFLLDWLQSPDLRQRITHGLNKHELRNALAKAVFFHRLGELRDRSLEDQMHRASGLNLLIAAIVLWNTAYLDKAVAQLRAAGWTITNEQLEHIAPLGWQHINLTGDYSWDFSQATSLDRLRPLRP